MNGFVTTVPPTPVEPEQTVTLELSIEEFAMLENLRHTSLRGHSDLRVRIDTVFAAVTRDLEMENRVRIADARGIVPGESSLVQRIFRG